MSELKNKSRYKLVVSDFHLGKGRFLRDRTLNILEDFVYDREWSEFLSYYRSGHFADAEVELILNGDILNLLQIDSWGVYTHLITERSTIRSVQKIVEGHRIFFDAIKKFAATAGHTISYVVGNHDVGMLWEGPRRVFSEACGIQVNFYDVYYKFDGIYVEHGQQYEKFSATNLRRPFITRRLPEPVLNLPWASLFVAVVLPKIKQERPHVDKVRPFQTFLSWTLMHDFFWGMKAIYLMFKFMIGTMFFRRRYHIVEGFIATLGLLKEITIYPHYDRIAFKILEENDDVNTVIMGHIHQLRYRLWREGKEYFNEGTWNEVTNLDLGDYGTRIRLTYAFIEYPQPESTSQRPAVRLKEWKGVWKPELEVLV
ncbi:MAG: hypothetical protein HY072_10440 [Deltaproteobacteria bacterium]|nr:hypothetical protein [Deltaproteobacteria bacterium]